MAPILRPNVNSQKTSLILFPYAGGTGEYYHSWLSQFDSIIEPQYSQLPGRGRYLLKNAYDDVIPLSKKLSEEVLSLGSSNIALFGHSMGALIAFELAKTLYHQHNFKVKHLFLSGHRAPSLPYKQELLHNLPEEDFFSRLHAMGGIPKEITLNDLKPFIPTLYRDFTLCENYSYSGKSNLPVPITLFYGKNDPWIQTEKLDLWQLETNLPLSVHAFEGDHFYLSNHTQAIIDIINTHIGEINDVNYSK